MKLRKIKEIDEYAHGDIKHYFVCFYDEKNNFQKYIHSHYPFEASNLNQMWKIKNGRKHGIQVIIK